MSDRESAGSSATGRRPRLTTRGRVAIGIALAAVLGGAVFVATSGVAGAHGSTPPLSQDQAASPSIPASAPASGSTPALRSAPVAAAPVQAPPVKAPPRTGTGQSVVLTAAQEPSQVGALFNGGIAAGHHCTASVVDSPAGDVIATAAHCLGSGASSHVFVPAYRDGTAPYGVWKIAQVLEDSAWTSSRDPDHDLAFAVVEPLNGRSLESVVGSYGLDTSGTADTTVQITGYPSSTDRPISCTGRSQRFTSTQLTVYCTGYAGGTSGSGWVEGYDPATGSGTLIGVIGGYQTGGDTEDVSYAAVFGAQARALYARAVAVA